MVFETQHIDAILREDFGRYLGVNYSRIDRGQEHARKAFIMEPLNGATIFEENGEQSYVVRDHALMGGYRCFGSTVEEAINTLNTQIQNRIPGREITYATENTLSALERWLINGFNVRVESRRLADEKIQQVGTLYLFVFDAQQRIHVTSRAGDTVGDVLAAYEELTWSNGDIRRLKNGIHLHARALQVLEAKDAPPEQHLVVQEVARHKLMMHEWEMLDRMNATPSMYPAFVLGDVARSLYGYLTQNR